MGTGRDIHDEPGARRPVRPQRRRLLAAAAPALALVLLLALPAYSTTQPAYYERYEGLRERMLHWRTSTHGYMSCAGCHVEPGFSGVLDFAVRSVPAFYSQLTLGPNDANLLKAPSSAACRKCHTKYRKVSPAGDLRIPHEAHVEVLRMDCVTCHERLVHHESDEGLNRPRMTMCLERCHDGERATSECDDCHTKKQVPPSHRQDDWLETHSEAAEGSECAGCHAWSPDFCQTCHQKRPEGHAGNWKKGHAEAARQRTEGCPVCHDEEFCERCHD